MITYLLLIYIYLETVIDDCMAVYFPGKVVKNLNFNEENHKISMLGLVDILAKQIPKHNQLKKH